MKSLLYLGTIIIMLSFTNCSKDKDLITIAGKWNALGIEYKEYFNGTTNVSTEPANPGAYIEFRPDGTFLSASISSFSAGVWSQTENKVTITNQGITETWTVKKLTKNDLELYWTDKEIYPTDYVEVTAFFQK